MSVPGDVIPAAPAGRDALGAAQALVQLAKPRVTILVLATMVSGALIAPGPADPATLGAAFLGTLLTVAAANALNMYLEADVDSLMERTRNRPLPSGRLAPEVALWFGVVLSFVGLGELTVLVHPITALLAATAIVSYVLAYTPLKRVSPLAVWVGAVPGGIPPLIGWASATGSLSPLAWTLFALLFVWQIPHFHAIAIFRTAEYERAAIRVLPAVRGLQRTKVSIVVLLALQLAVSLLPALAGLGGPAYPFIALLLGAAYLGWGLAGLRRDAGAAWARTLFFMSMPYLLLVFIALLVGP